MDLFQFIVAVLTVVGPLIGAVGYWIKKSSDVRLDQVKMQMEQVKADAQQVISSNQSIQSLTGAIVAQVEDRKDSTAATRENTSALKEVKVSILDWDDRQGKFFRDFSNHITAFSTEARKAIQSLEQVVETAIGGVSGRVDGVIPAMVSQVTPLVDKITLLVEEIQRTHSVEEDVKGGKLDRIETMVGQLVESMGQLQQTVEQVFKANTEVKHETPISGGAGSADGGIPADDPGDGTGQFELQPAGV